MGVYIEPISLRCVMMAREPAMTPWSTVSLSRFRRALERKICSLSSLTRRSRSWRRTVYEPLGLVAPAVAGSLGGGGAGVGGAVAAGAVAGAVAADAGEGF